MKEDEIKIRKKAAYISLAVGIGMLFAKSGAYFITGSAAIFSDAAESVIHVLATSMALYSIILSAKPADDSHLYGHGNVEYFSAGIEGFLIIAAALFIIYHAVTDIIVGPQLKQLDTGVIIITGAGIINLILGIYLIKMGRETNSLTLTADGKHVLTDAYTSAGVMIGIILVMITGFNLLDPLFAIAVAINILFTGYKLMRVSIGGLMIETNQVLMKKITARLAEIRKDFWIDIHELRFFQSGNIIFLEFHLILPYYFTIQHSHKIENEIEDLLLKEFDNLQMKIHFDFCVPDLCKYCGYATCKVRSDKKTINILWDEKKMKGLPVYQQKDIIV